MNSMPSRRLSWGAPRSQADGAPFGARSLEPSVIGVLTNGLVLLGVQEFWKKVITGFVIILAVVLDQLQERLQQRLALKWA